MYTTIQRWGNSQGVRIPKVFLDGLGLKENDRVELIQTGSEILVRKAVAHRSLEDRLTAFYGKPIEEIERLPENPEVEWGAPAGAERW